MSIEVTIICDECGRVIDGAKTAGLARAAIRESGGRVNLPGGKDICNWCVAERGPYLRVGWQHPSASR